MIRYQLVAEFADYLDPIPSHTGLHLAALARTGSVERIEAVARRAFTAGVGIQTLARFAVREHAQAGVVLGYGGIPTSDTRALRILRRWVTAF
jgi:GntR family transcriptional regulator/MocR family aminotransferase